MDKGSNKLQKLHLYHHPSLVGTSPSEEATIHRAKEAREIRPEPTPCKLTNLLIHLSILGELNKISFLSEL